MERFKEFERKVVKTLVGSHLSAEQVEVILDSASFVSYDYTNWGYFLTVRHPSLPSARIVCDKPLIVGRSGGIDCGFVVFLENGELTLECHPCGPEAMPQDFRARQVEIEAAA